MKNYKQKSDCDAYLTEEEEKQISERLDKLEKKQKQIDKKFIKTFAKLEEFLVLKKLESIKTKMKEEGQKPISAHKALKKYKKN